jgi:hypothetical protein
VFFPFEFTQIKLKIMAKSLELKRDVKAELAAKYERLAAVAGSAKKKQTWNFHARRFRNQVAAMQQVLDGPK